MLFVLRKRLENRRLPIMHTRDWKTNLKGQDLFSKIITIIVIKPKISTHKNIKKISKIKKIYIYKEKKSLKQLFLD